MPPGTVTRTARTVCDVAVFVAFAAVPFVHGGPFAEPFVAPRWYILHACAIVALISSALAGGLPAPALVAGHMPVVRLALAAATLSCIARGFSWGMRPLLDRVTVLVLVAALAGMVRRGAGVALGALVSAVAAVLAVAGLAGGTRSPVFGHPNMEAEFLAFGAVVALTTSWPAGALSSPGRRFRLAAGLAAVAVIAVRLAALGSRSALLGVSVALLVYAAARGQRWNRLLLGSTVLLVVGGALIAGSRPVATAAKKESVAVRWTLWRATFAMAADNPAGVGAGEFPHRFPAYQARHGPHLVERRYFRSPHSEPLRLLVEEGWAAACALLLAIAALAGALWRQLCAGRAGADHAGPAAALLAFAGIQAGVQFPLDLAPGVLAVSFVAATALVGAAPGGRVRQEPLLGAWGCGLAAAVGLVAFARIVTSDVTATRAPLDRDAQHTACRLDPRNVEACVREAWLMSAEARPHDAVVRLSSVLLRTPDYGPALKLRGELLLATGRTSAGCRDLLRHRTVTGLAGPPYPGLASCGG